MVWNRANGKSSAAIVADVGPMSHLGEGSIQLAARLEIKGSPKAGGARSGIVTSSSPKQSRPGLDRSSRLIPKELDGLLSGVVLPESRVCLLPGSKHSLIEVDASLGEIQDEIRDILVGACRCPSVLQLHAADQTDLDSRGGGRAARSGALDFSEFGRASPLRPVRGARPRSGTREKLNSWHFWTFRTKVTRMTLPPPSGQGLRAQSGVSSRFLQVLEEPGSFVAACCSSSRSAFKTSETTLAGRCGCSWSQNGQYLNGGSPGTTAPARGPSWQHRLLQFGPT